MLPLQAGIDAPSFIDLIRSTNLTARVVLVILAGFSVLSWAVIIDRLWLLRKAERESRRFLETFRTSSKFSQVRTACAQTKAAPLAALFLAGYGELSKQLEDRQRAATAAAASRPPSPPVSLASVERSLQRAAHGQRRHLERMMLFLATTGSATPFIGLFGTVWGIMSAFQAIGRYGTANLAVVAPGISEALITTVAGLATAIPAVIAYNHILGRIRTLTTAMQDFGLEFLNVIEQTFDTHPTT